MTSLDTIKLMIKKQLIHLAVEDESLTADCQKTLEFLEKVDNAFTRKNLSGHITGSGWVLNKDMTKVLLIHHKILDIWVQPGGHIDLGEQPVEAADREVFEETGLKDIWVGFKGIFDVDVHSIPENTIKKEPEHTHYDLRYLFISETEEFSGNPVEIEDAKWFDLDAIVNVPEKFLPSIVRMARRTLEHAKKHSV